MTAAELVCRQAGLPPIGDVGSTAETCIMCGREILPGEHRSKFHPSSSFMDDADLCAKEKSKTVCGFCVHLTDKKLMFSTQRVCITKEHVLPAAKLAHRKWLLLHPPQPPFLFLQSDTKLSHMIWRTPVTMSRDLWYVRMSGRLFMVRLPLVRNALELFTRIAKRYEAANPKKPPLRHPFGSLDFELRDVAGWRFRADVVINAEESALIAKLRPGEFWALAILTTKQEPEQPKENSKTDATI